MPSLVFIDHASELFFGSLAFALLVGLVRSAAPRVPLRRRFARLFGTPLVFLGLLVTVAHLASSARPSFGPAMALALVSPVSRVGAVRKLGAWIRENEKTPLLVEQLVALDLTAHDCAAAESDAYRYRARSSWPKIGSLCGPSPLAARALYEDGHLDEAAVAFERARISRPGGRLEIDELSAYIVTKRVAVAIPSLRMMSVGSWQFACLADALAEHAGTKDPGPSSRDERCGDVLAPIFVAPPSFHHPTRGERTPPRCAPHREIEDPPTQQPCSPEPPAYVPAVPSTFPIATERDGAQERAGWLLAIDDFRGALATIEPELAKYGSAPRAYSDEPRKQHEELLADVRKDDPGNVWIDASCNAEARVPPGHPLAARVASDRARFDPARDAVEREAFWNRALALGWAYSVAVASLDGEQSRLYLERAAGSPLPRGTLGTFGLDRAHPIFLAFTSEAARDELSGLDPALVDAAAAGSGTALAARLRALDASGVGVADIVGRTIPNGRAALVSFSRFDARLDCDRPRADKSIQTRCSLFSLVGALGKRHRVARAVGDEDTMRESRQAIDRLVGDEANPWRAAGKLGAMLFIAEEVLLSDPPPTSRE